jgi:hypothetical protein
MIIGRLLVELVLKIALTLPLKGILKSGAKFLHARLALAKGDFGLQSSTVKSFEWIV